MATTPNLGLHKPARTDIVSVVTDINNNMDTLDSKIGAVPAGHDVEEQITTLSDQIAAMHDVGYVDISDSTPVNIASKTGYVVTKTNFLSAVSQDDGIICLPYVNSGVMYAKLASYSDVTATVSGSHSIRIYYRK